MMAAFFKTSSWIGTDVTQYAPNVYFIDSMVPLVSVKLRAHSFRDAGSGDQVEMGTPGGVVRMPLPRDAVPAAGTDGQLAVINVETGEEWGLNQGQVLSDGSWLASGAYRYTVRASGIPPEGFGQRGAGIGQFAGIVLACDVERGRVAHALTLAYNYPCEPTVCRANGWPGVIPPFRKTDGNGTSRYDIPEGARLAIRPDITQQQINEACRGIKGCIVWSMAMQQYGGFIVDRSGHPKSYAEGDATAHWDPKVWSGDMLRNIPPNWYVVVDWNYPSTRSSR